jgi:RNA polymerase sigma-32 factor
LALSTAVVPAYAGDDTLRGYIRKIKQFPLLSPAEESRLAYAWRDQKDQHAAQRLVQAHLRLVVKIAMGYRGYGLPMGDLVSEGSVGLMQAVKRFDPDRGFRLSTYAMWWIRAAIQSYILHSWSLVKMGTTAAQKRLFFNLRRLKGKMQALDDGDLTPEHVTAIAKTMAVDEKDVVDMNRRLNVDTSLNVTFGHEDGDSEWQDLLTDDSDSAETILGDRQEFQSRSAMLTNALSTLNERDRHILVERRLKETPATLENLARHHGISGERVRQLEVRAFGKLQKSMREQVEQQRSEMT